MLYVSLNNIEINGLHGAYPEEKILGNTFIVNVKVGSNNEQAFIDYAEIMKVVKSVFAKREDYLETLIMNIEKQLITTLGDIHFIYISIKKMHPPLDANLESSEVVLEKNY